MLSGPHFFVGLPFYKTPRAVCTANSHYDCLDLNQLPDDYLPRTNYVPNCSPAEYAERTPRVPWLETRGSAADVADSADTPNTDGSHAPTWEQASTLQLREPAEAGRWSGQDRVPTRGVGTIKRVTEFYRFVNREMLSQSGERTLIAIIIPPGAAYIHTCLGSAFKSNKTLLDYFSLCISIPVDYRVKSTGMGHANSSLINQLPVLADDRYRSTLHARALALSCLTTHYANLWQSCYRPDFRQQRWSSDSPLLDPDFFANLTPTWQRTCALRKIGRAHV